LVGAFRQYNCVARHAEFKRRRATRFFFGRNLIARRDLEDLDLLDSVRERDRGQVWLRLKREQISNGGQCSEIARVGLFATLTARGQNIKFGSLVGVSCWPPNPQTGSR